MFIDVKLEKILARPRGAERGCSHLLITRNIALRWSAGRGSRSCVYKHLAPPEPPCYLSAVKPAQNHKTAPTHTWVVGQFEVSEALQNRVR
jgi:hypothetical protein